MDLEAKLAEWLPEWLYRIVCEIHDTLPFTQGEWTYDENGDDKW